MYNKILTNHPELHTIRSVEQVALRAMALGVTVGFLDDVIAAEMYSHGEEISEPPWLRGSHEEMVNWLTSTKLIQHMTPDELSAVLRPEELGSMANFWPAWEYWVRRWHALLWAISNVDNLPFTGTMPGEDPSKYNFGPYFFSGPGQPIEPTLATARLRDEATIRVMAEALREKLPIFASGNPEWMRLLSTWGYHNQFGSRPRLVGQYNANWISRRHSRITTVMKGVDSALGWVKLEANFRGRAFMTAHHYYCALAWILDDRRDWKCDKVF